jgi:hypothetical protein
MEQGTLLTEAYMKLAFVAGPYRAVTEWGVTSNVRRAELLALELWQLGLAVICPHKNTEHFGGFAHDDVWLNGALEMVRRCDLVVCTADWEKSEGARGEVELAKEVGLPVFYSISEVQAWLKSQE